MSERFPGGVISATPVVPTPSSAPGIWTLDQQEQAQAAGTWPFGGPFTYIEDVFSTYLYTGNGSTQTITNGIDLAGKGGLVWIKNRGTANNHTWFTTDIGPNLSLVSNNTAATSSGWYPNYFAGFNSNGYSLGSSTDNAIGSGSASTNNFVSWTFRKQPKFFDVVTYTGDGEFLRVIDHNLQGTLGALFIKATSTTGDWFAWCRTETGGSYLKLNSTAAQITTGTVGTESYFIVGTNTAGQNTNASGVTYVAYLFAHNAGGFGLTGTDNVISCGSYAGSSGDVTVNLGYEPQWVMIKPTTTASGWVMMDSMRGMPVGGQDQRLYADASYAEGAGITGPISPTATGFTVSPTDIGWNNSGQTYIYIAIRRGPMKVPTDGTKVFAPVATSSASSPLTVTTNFPVDLTLLRGTSYDNYQIVVDRLRGSKATSSVYLRTQTTGAESTSSGVGIGMDSNIAIVDTGFIVGGSDPKIYWNFRRAPGFFDEVCYTGNAVNGQTYAHNLGVAPELMIIKRRDTAGFQWIVYAAPLGASQYLALNLTDAAAGNFMFNATAPTASVFTVSANQNVNGNGTTLVNYLFASCPGVSKVGSYTGNGTSQTINCGFTGGARFVLLKRTDSTGDWYVYDTARGMTTPTDPYLLLNSTAAETSTIQSVVTVTGGFAVDSTFVPAVNVSGGTYIYLAIA